MYQRIPPVTQAKINLLLEELRSWEPGERKSTLNELAHQFDLDVFVVDRIARSEGLKIKTGMSLQPVTRPEPPESDPNASTLDLDPDEVQGALERPEPDPQYKDKDTGVWQKKTTGEWELVSGKKKD